MPWAIKNDTSIPAPHNVIHHPRQQVGTTLAGAPVIQGFAAQTWQWHVLDQAKMAALLALYDPAAPQVEITFRTRVTNTYVAKWPMMGEPTIGERFPRIYRNVSIRFTRIADTADA